MTQFNNPSTNSNKERASVLDSKAGITIEASIAIPLFLFAVLCLVYMIEVKAIQTKIYFAAETADKVMAQDVVMIPVVNVPKLEKIMIETIGEERLDRSILEGGSRGLDCSRSFFSFLTGEVHVTVRYSVRLPFPEFMGISARCREEIVVRGWTGFKNENSELDDEQIVYMTDNAAVYHEDYNCTYLQLSIQFIPYLVVQNRRNFYGERYRRCEKCSWNQNMSGIYITDKGNRYHSSLTCSGLKRSIYVLRRSQVHGIGGCSRCSGH